METSDTSKFTRHLTRWAVAGSAAYLALLVCLGWGRWPQLLTKDLNEVGDFLAGAFSPLAFFWLVVGYFQQGHELNQNTNALRMQHDELKESVAQAKQMVAINREELDALKQERHETVEAMVRATYVDFRLISQGTQKHMYAEKLARVTAGFDLFNYGADALNVRFVQTDGVARMTDSSIGHLRTNGKFSVGGYIDNPTVDDSDWYLFLAVNIQYQDTKGRDYLSPFEVWLRTSSTQPHFTEKVSVGITRVIDGPGQPRLHRIHVSAVGPDAPPHSSGR